MKSIKIKFYLKTLKLKKKMISTYLLKISQFLHIKPINVIIYYKFKNFFQG